MEPLKDFGWALNQMVWEQKTVTRESQTNGPKFVIEHWDDVDGDGETIHSSAIMQINPDDSKENVTFTSSYILATDWKVVEA